MNRLFPALSLLFLVPAAFSQQTIVETRHFDAELFDNLDFESFDLDVGLLGPTDAGDGMVVSVDIDLQVDWGFQFLLTNCASFAEIFRYETSLELTPATPDCQQTFSCNAYQTSGAGLLTLPVAPGDTVMTGVQVSDLFQWTGSDFQVGGSGEWSWPNARLLAAPLPFGHKLTFGEGAMVPRSWVQVLVAQAVVTGTMRIEWIPNVLPSQVLCPGNSTSAATLSATGDFDNLWLLQSGVSQNFNLLLSSDNAFPSVPANGICLDLGSPAFQRYPDSLAIGGAPFRIPANPAFSGTTQYFQAWYRTPVGPETGQCIGLLFP